MHPCDCPGFAVYSKKLKHIYNSFLNNEFNKEGLKTVQAYHSVKQTIMTLHLFMYITC